MSLGLQNDELEYLEWDKKDFAVLKIVNILICYLLIPKTKVFVPYPTLRNLLVQKELGETRSHFMTSLQDYNLEIKPAKIMRG